MLSKFFILRPIFATVVSIIVITMGVTALVKLQVCLNQLLPAARQFIQHAVK